MNLLSVLAAAAVAVGIRLVTQQLDATTQGRALEIACLQGALYTAVLIARTWPTGDPPALWRRLRGWMSGTPRLAPDGGGR